MNRTVCVWVFWYVHSLCTSLTPQGFFRSFKDLIAIPIDVLELSLKFPIYCTSINFYGVQIFVDLKKFELRLHTSNKYNHCCGGYNYYLFELNHLMRKYLDGGVTEANGGH